MKFSMKHLSVLFVFFLVGFSYSQNATNGDEELVKKACMGYIEGFYEGDSLKIINNVKPSLYKFGYWKNKETGIYEGDGHMTFQQAVAYSKSVLEKEFFAKADAPKIVEVLDLMDHIAAAKITAWWGYDYLLLSKTKDGWIIEQALWEGPLKKED